MTQPKIPIYGQPPCGMCSHEIATLRAENGALMSRAMKAEAELGRVKGAWNCATTQATNCGKCGVYKHTPWRDDHEGSDYGYICATCLWDLCAERMASNTRILTQQIKNAVRDCDAETVRADNAEVAWEILLDDRADLIARALELKNAATQALAALRQHQRPTDNPNLARTPKSSREIRTDAAVLLLEAALNERLHHE